jgi:DNA (cytosine-5)-methyltransferase 1
MVKLLYVDLFCGAGGTSTGVEQSRHNGKKCAKVIACVNHDATAIASHAANHPDALHFTEDIKTLKLSPLVAHVEKMKAAYPGALLVLWASLECTNFSKAKGGKPRDADSRTLGLHLFRYIEAVRPDYIKIENVEEFMSRSWTKSDKKGRAIKDSTDYYSWVARIEAYGFGYAHRILNAADYGAYTSRRRFFGIFAKKGLPIAFPQPTHAKNNNENLFGSLKKWKPVKDVLNFSEEGESIFARKKPLSDKTLARIYAGLIKFVAGGKDNFLLKYNSMGQNGRYNTPDVDAPCPTAATQDRLRLCSAQFEKPAHTVTPIDHHALTTVSFIGRYNGQPEQGVNAVSIDVPAPTLTVKDRLSLISPKFIVSQYSGGGQHSSIDGVCPAVLTNPKQNVVSCTTWVVNTNFSNIGSAINEPSQTITANRKWHYLMSPQYYSAGGRIASMDKMPPYLIYTETGEIAIEVYDTDSEPMRRIKEFMALYGIIDIKMRTLRIIELLRIMGFPDDYVLIGTKEEQKKYIGNAVEVKMARVMCEALAEKIK